MRGIRRNVQAGSDQNAQGGGGGGCVYARPSDRHDQGTAQSRLTVPIGSL